MSPTQEQMNRISVPKKEKKAPKVAKEKKAPVQRETPKFRHFKIDDDGADYVFLRTTSKMITVSLALGAEQGKKRRVGVITKSTRTMEIKRNRELHLFRKGNAYGFNEYILRTAQSFNTIRLSDEQHQWKIPVSFIIENGKYLNFKQQGYEKQLFVSLEQLGPYRVYKNEGRRI